MSQTNTLTPFNAIEDSPEFQALAISDKLKVIDGWADEVIEASDFENSGDVVKFSEAAKKDYKAKAIADAIDARVDPGVVGEARKAEVSRVFEEAFADASRKRSLGERPVGGTPTAASGAAAIRFDPRNPEVTELMDGLLFDRKTRDAVAPFDLDLGDGVKIKVGRIAHPGRDLFEFVMPDGKRVVKENPDMTEAAKAAISENLSSFPDTGGDILARLAQGVIEDGIVNTVEGASAIAGMQAGRAMMAPFVLGTAMAGRASGSYAESMAPMVEADKQLIESVVEKTRMDTLNAVLDSIAPVNPMETAESFVGQNNEIFRQLPRAVGQGLGNVAIGVASGGAAPLTLFAANAAAMGNQAAEEAVNAGRPEAAVSAFLENAIAGGVIETATDLFFTKAFKAAFGKSLNAASRGATAKIAQRFKESLVAASQGAASEAGAEALQTMVANDVARRHYDENRELFKGIEEAAAIGALTGLILGGGPGMASTGLEGVRAMRKANEKLDGELASTEDGVDLSQIDDGAVTGVLDEFQGDVAPVEPPSSDPAVRVEEIRAELAAIEAEEGSPRSERVITPRENVLLTELEALEAVQDEQAGQEFLDQVPVEVDEQTLKEVAVGAVDDAVAEVESTEEVAIKRQHADILRTGEDGIMPLTELADALDEVTDAQVLEAANLPEIEAEIESLVPNDTLNDPLSVDKPSDTAQDGSGNEFARSIGEFVDRYYWDDVSDSARETPGLGPIPIWEIPIPSHSPLDPSLDDHRKWAQMSPDELAQYKNELQDRALAAEKDPGRQLTPEEAAMSSLEFSRHRGYTEAEIAEYDTWQRLLGPQAYNNDIAVIQMPHIARAVSEGLPVSAKAVKAYEIIMPDNYSLVGDQYVSAKSAPASPAQSPANDAQISSTDSSTDSTQVGTQPKRAAPKSLTVIGGVLEARISQREDGSFGVETVNAKGSVVRSFPESFQDRDSALKFIQTTFKQKTKDADGDAKTQVSQRAEKDDLMDFLATEKMQPSQSDIKTIGSVARKQGKGFRPTESDAASRGDYYGAPLIKDYQANPEAQGRLRGIYSRESKNRPDQLADRAFQKGWISAPTAEALFEAIKQRLDGDAGRVPQTRVSDAEVAQTVADRDASVDAGADAFFDSINSPFRSEAVVDAGILQEGDVLQVGEDRVTVLGADADGVMVYSDAHGQFTLGPEDQVGYDAAIEEGGNPIAERESIVAEDAVTPEEAKSLNAKLKEWFKARSRKFKARGSKKSSRVVSSKEHTGLVRSKAELEAARRIARMFGLRVVGVSEAPGNGFIIPGEDRRNVYIATDTDRSEMLIVMHELLHQMKQNARALYDSLADLLEADLAAYVAEDGPRPQLAGLDVDIIIEEFLADYLSDYSAQPAFWQGLAKRDANLFAEIAEYILKFLSDLRAKIMAERIGVERYLKDAQAMNDAILDVLVEYRKLKKQSDKGLLDGTIESNLPFADERIPARNQDAEYLALAKDPEANRAELQAMVDEKKSRNGWTLSHRRGRKDDLNPRETGRIIQFTESGGNLDFGNREYVARPADMGRLPRWAYKFGQEWARTGLAHKPDLTEDQVAYLMNPSDIVGGAWFWDEADFVAKFKADPRNEGVAGYLVGDGAVVFSSELIDIQSADPVTYDEQGNVIPLSERFDTGKDDIRFADERTFSPAHDNILKTLTANASDGYATEIDTDPLEGGKVRAIAKLLNRLYRESDRIDWSKNWKGRKKAFAPGQEAKFMRDVKKASGRIVETLRIARAIFPDFQSWYESRLKMAMDIFTELDPDAKKPENNFILRALLAITSNGNKVNDQTSDSWNIYQAWKTTGSLDNSASISGTRTGEIRKALGRLDLLLSKHGWAKMDEFLKSEGTVRELRQRLVDDLGFTKEEAADATTGELADEVVPFSLIFGPKLGSFFNNLSGNFDTTTMDRWFMRTFGRALGSQLTKVSKQEIAEKRDRLAGALAAAAQTGQGRSVLRAAGLKASASATNNTAVRLADYFEKAENREGIVEDSPVDVLRLAANGLFKIADGYRLEEAPRSGGHRRFIRLAMSAARDTFNLETGLNWSAAELQALLWYFEKHVHDTYGSKQTDDTPDYGSAANRLFRRERGGGDARAFGPSDAIRRGSGEGTRLAELGASAARAAKPDVNDSSRRAENDILFADERRPAATREDVSLFRDVTSSLSDKPTQAQIDAWKIDNPDAYADLKAMRERVLRDAGYRFRGWHESAEAWSEYDFSRSSDAGRAIWFALDEDADSASTGASETGVWRKFLIRGNYKKADSRAMADWREGDFSIEKISERQRGLITGMGYDGLVSPMHRWIAVIDPANAKSTEPLNLDESGNLITPDQWGDAASNDIRFADERDTKYQQFYGRDVGREDDIQKLKDVTIPAVRENYFDSTIAADVAGIEEAMSVYADFRDGHLDPNGELGLDNANQTLVGELTLFAAKMIRERNDFSLYNRIKMRGNDLADREATVSGRALQARGYYKTLLDAANGSVQEAKEKIVGGMVPGLEKEVVAAIDKIDEEAQAARREVSFEDLSPEVQARLIKELAEKGTIAAKPERATKLAQDFSRRKDPGAEVKKWAEEADAFLSSVLDDIRFADERLDPTSKRAILERTIREQMMQGKRKRAAFMAQMKRIDVPEDRAAELFDQATAKYQAGRAAEKVDAATRKAAKKADTPPTLEERIMAEVDAEAKRVDALNNEAAKISRKLKGENKRKPSTKLDQPLDTLVKTALESGDNFNRDATIKEAVSMGMNSESAAKLADAIEVAIKERALKRKKNEPTPIGDRVKEIVSRFDNPQDRPKKTRDPLRVLINAVLAKDSKVTEASFAARMKAMGATQADTASLWSRLSDERNKREGLRQLQQQQKQQAAPQTEAESIIKKLAEGDKGGKKNIESAVRQSYNEVLKADNLPSRPRFIESLKAIGVNEDTAGRLYDVALKKRQDDHRKRLDRSSKAALKASAPFIFNEIIKTPGIDLQGPQERMATFIRLLQERAGMSFDDARAMAKVMEADLIAQWTKVSLSVAEKYVRDRNAPWYRREPGLMKAEALFATLAAENPDVDGAAVRAAYEKFLFDDKRPKHDVMMEAFVALGVPKVLANKLAKIARTGGKGVPSAFDMLRKAVRAGALDPTKRTLDEIAIDNGWTDLTDADLKQLMILDARLAEENLTDTEEIRIRRDMIRIYQQSALPDPVIKVVTELYIANIFSGISTALLGLSGFASLAVGVTRDAGAAAVGSTVGAFNPSAEVAKSRNLTGFFTAFGRLPRYFARGFIDAAVTTRTGDMKNVLADEINSALSVTEKAWDKQLKIIQNPNVSKARKAAAAIVLLHLAPRFSLRVLSSFDSFVKGVIRNYTQELELFSKAANLGWNRAKIREMLTEIQLQGAKFQDEAIARGFTNWSDRNSYVSDRISMALFAAMRGKGIETSGVQERAIMEANMEVGINEIQPGTTHLGEIANAIQRAVAKSDVRLRALVPVVRTPWNIYHRSAWYSPWGLVRLFETGRRTKGFRKWDDSPYPTSLASPEQLILRSVESTMGLALAGFFGKMVFDQIFGDDEEEDKWLRINLAGPPKGGSGSDRLRHTAWLEAGRRPHTVQFKTGPEKGDWLTLGFRRGGLEALNFPLTLIGSLEQMEYTRAAADATPSSRYFATLVSENIGEMLFFMRPFTSRGYVMDESSWGRELAFRISGFVPFASLLNTPKRFEEMREQPDTFAAAVAMNLPVVPYAMEVMGAEPRKVALNSLGDPIGLGREQGSFLMSRLGIPVGVVNEPARPKTQAGVTEQSVNVLWLDQNYFPSVQSRADVERTAKRPITDMEYQRFVVERGKIIKRFVSENYFKLAPLDKEKFKEVVSEQASKATTRVKKGMRLQ